MRDETKVIVRDWIGHGGVHCPCCNPFYGARDGKARLRRAARRVLRDRTRSIARVGEEG